MPLQENAGVSQSEQLVQVEFPEHFVAYKAQDIHRNVANFRARKNPTFQRMSVA